MCIFSCIAFIDYVLPGKVLQDCINLFSSNDHKKNDKIVYKYFQGKCDRRGKTKNDRWNKELSFGRNKKLLFKKTLKLGNIDK